MLSGLRRVRLNEPARSRLVSTVRLSDLVRQVGGQRHPGDPDLEAGRETAARPVSSPPSPARRPRGSGITRDGPGGRSNGSSMPLASAISRQRRGVPQVGGGQAAQGVALRSRRGRPPRSVDTASSPDDGGRIDHGRDAVGEPKNRPRRISTSTSTYSCRRTDRVERTGVPSRQEHGEPLAGIDEHATELEPAHGEEQHRRGLGLRVACRAGARSARCAGATSYAGLVGVEEQLHRQGPGLAADVLHRRARSSPGMPISAKLLPCSSFSSSGLYITGKVSCRWWC